MLACLGHRSAWMLDWSLLGALTTRPVRLTAATKLSTGARRRSDRRVRLSHHPDGIKIQTYCAIIACLLINLWTGRQPIASVVPNTIVAGSIMAGRWHGADESKTNFAPAGVGELSLATGGALDDGDVAE